MTKPFKSILSYDFRTRHILLFLIKQSYKEYFYFVSYKSYNKSYRSYNRVKLIQQILGHFFQNYLTCQAIKILINNGYTLQKKDNKHLITDYQNQQIQKSSILVIMNNEGQSSQIVHTDFDHVYYDTSSNAK